MDKYKAELMDITDDELVREAETKVWLSAYAANNSRSKYHAECDAVHEEARRRMKPWLYQQGWNAAYTLCGYALSDRDRELAVAQDQPQ